LAVAAAALLVAPGMRQPLALELRCGSEDLGGVRGPPNGPEAEAWLLSVQQAASQALGHRIKLEVLRLRLSAKGCANLDILDMPEKTNLLSLANSASASNNSNNNGGNNHNSQQAAAAKVEELHKLYVGSSANLLVCVEPGPSLELCRKYDPTGRRTVLIGAASAEAAAREQLPASTLCGPAAAQSLEDRFAALCAERVPQWMSQLERLELRLTKAQREAREMEYRESSEEVLRKARSVGLSFGRALQHVIGGTPGCTAAAMTLEEEIMEFANAAAKGLCDIGDGVGPGVVSSKDAKTAAEDLFARFGGVTGYTNYLKDQVRISGADVPLNGGAAWQRLLAEVEVAMRLAHPSQEDLNGLMLAAVRCGGTGVHGHQRWEEVASKLMLGVSFEPLRRRVRYVATRVVWVLKHQKATVSEWMSTLADGPASRFYSPLFTEHLEILRTYPIVRELVFSAYDRAASAIGEQVLKNLEGTLVAACINPDVMLRPSTEPELVEGREQDASSTEAPPAVGPDTGSAGGAGAAAGNSAAAATPGRTLSSGALLTRSTSSANLPTPGRARSAAALAAAATSVARKPTVESRNRVASEMQRRSDCVGGLPVQLRDRVFEPGEAVDTMPYVEGKLRRAFAVLARILANQAFAFADTSMTYLCQRRVDEAMTTIDFSPDQKRALSIRHEELDGIAKQVEQRLAGVRRCIATFRGEMGPGSPPTTTQSILRF